VAAARVQAGTVQANGLEFAVLEAGSGPLALCLHGFPDCAHTWRYLLPALAGAGFHAVAPFMRGYAPTQVPADGAYQLGALVADAIALHEALGGAEDAVLVGHDWGAETAYGAAAFAPDRWRRLVTLAVPPAALDPVLFSDFDQLRRFWYIFMFRDPARFAEAVVAADGMAFIDRLWREWSPGYQAADHLALVKESLRGPGNLAAAIGYYRATGAPGAADQEDGRYAREQAAIGRQPPQPTLYLHGAADGCVRPELARAAEQLLAPGSRMMVVEDAGHFLQLEQPAQLNDQVIAWLAG
jgi:pimeloyl-ACP methyl ester carboxylesterase